MKLCYSIQAMRSFGNDLLLAVSTQLTDRF